MYKTKYLPTALADILEIESSLFELNATASDNFTDAITQQIETLSEHPHMYQVYEDNNYFRSMPLPYGYRLFYHVDEKDTTINIHRVLHVMRDLGTIV